MAHISLRAPARLAAAGALAALLSALPACARTPPPPPNLVVISLDTLRRDRLNCYGYTARRLSPRIDALAADSVLFENAVAASPWTTPSHMSLLTSLAPSSHGVMAPFTRLAEGLRTHTVERLPDHRVTLAEALAAHGFATGAFTGGATLDPAIGFAQGFGSYDVSQFKINDAGMGRVKGWIAAQQGRRFFLFWHTFEVHEPYLDTTFVDQAVPAEAAPGVRAALGEISRHLAQGAIPPEAMARLAAFKPHYRALSQALYDGGVRSADRRVGELLDFLRESGLYDRTLIVLTSDHGEELWERTSSHIWGAHGHSLFDEMVAVPLVMKLPGQERAGTRLSPLAPAVDVMPTVLEVLQVPAAAAPQMEGRSLRPLWEGRPVEARPAFTEALAYDSEQKSIRTDRYKYILSVPADEVAKHGRRFLPENAARQLYDLLADPAERSNLLMDAAARPARPGASPPAPALVEALDRRLRVHVASRSGTAEKTTLAPETLESLKALGYLK